MSPSSLIIKAGHVDMNKMKEFPVVEVHSHEKFNKRTFENDVAILKIGVPFHMEEGILEPIVLDREDPKDGSKCIVSGWGTQRQNTTEMPTKLYYTEVKTMARKSCAKAYQLFNKVTNNMICAGFEKEIQDACEVSIVF